jgi:hypothetical protein
MFLKVGDDAGGKFGSSTTLGFPSAAANTRSSAPSISDELRSFRHNETLITVERNKRMAANHSQLHHAGDPEFGCRWNILYGADLNDRAKRNCDILKQRGHFVYFLSTEEALLKTLSIKDLPLDIVMVEVDSHSFRGWQMLSKAKLTRSLLPKINPINIAHSLAPDDNDECGVHVENDECFSDVDERNSEDYFATPLITVALLQTVTSTVSSTVTHRDRRSSSIHADADVHLNAPIFTYDQFVKAVLG